MFDRCPILTTERLILRNFCPLDLDELVDYRNNPRSNQYQRGQLRERGDLEKLIARRASDVLDGVHSGQFAIALREKSGIANDFDAISTNDSLAIQAANPFGASFKIAPLIGEISVLVNGDSIELGYTLSYKHHRNGYATEILAALIARLRALNPNCTFIAHIDPENAASLALAKKLGFRETGRDEQENCITFSL